MSKFTTQFGRRLTRLINSAINRGEDPVEIIGALELAKCNVAISNAAAAFTLAAKKQVKKNNNN